MVFQNLNIEIIIILSYHDPYQTIDRTLNIFNLYHIARDDNCHRVVLRYCKSFRSYI